MDYWGKCVPKLVDYGTTAHGQLIFIATEFVKHNPRELFDEAIANAARKALRTVHVSGMLHGDLHEGNILVTKGGVQFIDFGFAKFNPRKAECKKEFELLEKFIQKKRGLIRNSLKWHMTGPTKLVDDKSGKSDTDKSLLGSRALWPLC
ncbi:unnamed protein product [Calypogeia fissa]